MAKQRAGEITRERGGENNGDRDIRGGDIVKG